MDIKEYDALIMVTPNDFKRVECLYERLLRLMPVRKLKFVGSQKVGELVDEYKKNAKMFGINIELLSKIEFVCEEDILSFDEVHTVMKDVLRGTFEGELPRGITGWYYQQFLKMKYADICTDEYYMVWDGDTVPCKQFSMFKEGTETPYLDLKAEYHEEYFITLGKILPGMCKCIRKSFISEHMLIKTDIMLDLIQTIESNSDISGACFWEKIIRCIEIEKLKSNSFSEFETYGSFAAFRYVNSYMLRDWHSFRYGGEFFDINNINESDFEWLGKDFFAISFEKNHYVRDDHKNLFDNKEYQEKLSARQMLQVAQEAFGEECYREVW